MSEPAPPPPASNGHHGSVLISVSERLIRVLPPAFIGLLLVNVLFIALVAWLFDHAAENRNALLTRIVDRCLVAPGG